MVPPGIEVRHHTKHFLSTIWIDCLDLHPMEMHMPMWLEAVDPDWVIPTVEPLGHRCPTGLQEDVSRKWIESQVLCELRLISFRIVPDLSLIHI